MTRTGTSVFPNSVDSFDRIGTTTYEDDVGYDHMEVHNEVMDAVEKIEGGRTTYVAKSANYTASPNDSKIMATSGTASIAITLPTAVGYSGKVFTIKKVDSGSGTVVVTAAGAETIDGSSTAPIKVQNVSLEILSNGVNWNVI